MLNFIKKNPALLYLSFLIFGISLCTALQLSNLSSIFRFVGASTSYLPALWLAPPLTGLIIQPLIGQISDDTTTRYGKRLPYIIFWSALAALSCLALPYLPSLFLVVIITLIMNCSLNGGTEALRALTGDLLSKDADCSKAFSMQAFFAGIGGALGAGLPYLIYITSGYLHITLPISTDAFPMNLKIAFVISGSILLLITALILFKVREKSYKHAKLLNKKLKHLSLKQRTTKIVKDFYSSFKKIPPRFKTICLIHSLSWAGIFIFWLYFTTALAQNLYGMPSHSVSGANPNDVQTLQKATLDTSFYFSIYQYVSIFYAALLYFISKGHTKSIYIHAVSLLIGSIAIILLPIERTSIMIEYAMIAYGIMWGSVMVLPYAIALHYLPRGKLGIYLGIFNVCITAPQIICGLTLSFIYSYLLKENACYLLSLGGVLIALSAGLWLKFIRAEPKKSFKLKEALSFE